MKNSSWLLNNNNQAKIIGLVFFITIIGLFSCLFIHWGVQFDDYAYIASSYVDSCADLVKFFCGRDHYSLLLPSNGLVGGQEFFQVYYRPLCRLLFALQVPFFGAQPFGYFFIMIFFHVVNAVLLYFFIYALTKSLEISIWAACFFVFHISLGTWMGWIAAQNYTVTLTFILLAALFFLSYYIHGSYWRIALATMCYGIAILFFEFVIFFPFVLALLWFMRDFLSQEASIQIGSFKSFFVSLIPFFSVVFVFLFVRSQIYPIHNALAFPAVSLSYLKMRFYADGSSLIAMLCNIPYVRSGDKLPYFLLIMSLFRWLWFKNSYRSSILILVGSFCLAVWPITIKWFFPRYLYFGLPIFVLIIVLLLQYAQIASWHRRLVMNIAWIVVFINIGFVLSTMLERQSYSFFKYQAYQTLCKDHQLEGRIICFIGLAQAWRTDPAHAVWAHGINRTLPIYFDEATFVTGLDPLSAGAVVIPVSGGFRLTVCNQQQDWFVPCGERLSMGSKKVLAVNESNGYPTDLYYYFDKFYLDQNILFISWDAKLRKYYIVRASQEDVSDNTKLITRE